MSKPIPNEPESVNSGSLTMVLVLVAVATLAIALVVTALVREELTQQGLAKDLSQENAVRTLRAAQLAELGAQPTWKDKAAGLVTVPVKVAKSLVLDALRTNPYALSPGAKPPEGMGGAGPVDEGTDAGDSSASDAKKDVKSADEGSKTVARKPAALAPATPAAAPSAQGAAQ